MALEEATLHVVLAATHTFDKDLVDTVVQVPCAPCSPHSVPNAYGGCWFFGLSLIRV